MDIRNLPKSAINPLALSDLVFTDFNDAPDNPRPGLGYHQLYDPTKMVSLIAKLPEVTRVGDTITLYWDTVNVQQYDLDQPTIDKGWLSFSVSPDLINAPQGEVYYMLLDHAAGTPELSPSRTVAVNRKPPGGLDPNTETAINEALAPCTVTPSLISSPDVAVTVNVPAWIDQEVGDELTVMWNNIRVDHPKLSTLGAQSVSIPKAVLEAGGSSVKLMVNYEIRDSVDNYSLVSPTTFVTVEIDPLALPAPRVDEADRTTLVLDLEALGDKDGHVTIPPHLGNGNRYVVTLEWIGKTPTAEIILTLAPQTVDDPTFDHATFTIPNADLKQIAGGSAVLRYTLLQTGDAVEKKSKTTSITLTGLPIQLQAPVVQEAGGTSTIDLALITGANVNVLITAYSGQSAGDKILLSWKGTDANGTPVNYTAEYIIKAGEELKDTTFIVPRQNIDPLGGGSLSLSYQVVFSATGNPQNSAVMTYTVTGKRLQLAPPTVDEADGSIIDPAKVTSAATVRIKPYDGKDFGDIVYLSWDGTTQGGTPLTYSDEYSVGQNENTADVTFLVNKTHLDPLLNGALSVSYRVLSAATGNIQPSDAAAYSVGSNTLLPMPTVDNAPGDEFDPITNPQGTSVHVDGLAIALKPQDIVTVYWKGSTAEGTSSRAFKVATANQMLTWPITAAIIAPSQDASVEVYYEVVRSAGGQSTSATRTLTILGGGVGAEITDDFTSHVGDLISAGGSVTTPHMTIRFLSGTGQAGFAPGYILPPEAADYFANPVLQVAYASSGNQTLELALNTECRSVKCDVHGAELNNTTIRYLDSNKTELSAQVLAKETNQHLQYESPGNLIRYIEITSQNKDWTLWDNFVMTP